MGTWNTCTYTCSTFCYVWVWAWIYLNNNTITWTNQHGILKQGGSSFENQHWNHQFLPFQPLDSRRLKFALSCLTSSVTSALSHRAKGVNASILVLQMPLLKLKSWWEWFMNTWWSWFLNDMHITTYRMWLIAHLSDETISFPPSELEEQYPLHRTPSTRFHDLEALSMTHKKPLL